MTADDEDQRAAHDRAARARRRAEIFGDALPDEPRDRDPDGGREDRSRDDDLRRDVPPHHGG